MGDSMKKDKQKSLKTITLDKNRLKQEMKLHTGSGVNGSCTYDDVAEILGYASGKTIINKKYTFTEKEIKKLCAKWNVRCDYIKGVDDWRTKDDYEHFLDIRFATNIQNEHIFFDSLNIKHDFMIFALCPADKWQDSFKNYFYFWDSLSSMYYIKMNSTEMVEIFDNNYLLDIDMFYVFKNTDDEIINIINQKTWRYIIDVLRDNAIKGFYDFLKFAPAQLDINISKSIFEK